MTTFRKVAVAYAICVGLAATWAWYADVTLLHSGREHLLPDITLCLVSLPSSLLIGILGDADRWFAAWLSPFGPLVEATFCGAGQAAVLFLASSLAERLGRGKG